MWIAPPSGLRFISACDDGVGELHHFVANARARRALAAVDGQERLGDRDRDLRRLEADHRAVAADHLVLLVAAVGRGHRASGFAGQEIAPGLGRRGGGSARELHGRVSCRNLVVVNASSGFSPVRALSRNAGRRAGFGDYALGVSLWALAPGRRRRREGSQFLLANQNLQHLVLKCLLSTKHSRVGGAWQALFDAQERGPKNDNKNSRLRRRSRHIHARSTAYSPGCPQDAQPTNGCAHVAVLRQSASASSWASPLP